jgi:hypothetical protein
MDSNSLSYAVIRAQSGAEAFKSYHDTSELAYVLGGVSGDNVCIVYYDSDWNISSEQNAAFVMRIEIGRSEILRNAEIVVYDSQSSEIFKLRASAILEEGRQ